MQGEFSIQDVVFQNAVDLVQGLPATSTLKHVLLNRLFHSSSISATAVCAALPEMMPNTVKAYLGSSGDDSVLNLKQKPDVKRARTAGLEERARDWIVDTCGKTESGRTADVRKTPRSATTLWQKYREEHPGGLSYLPFLALCKEESVHFGVGKVDAMTCVQCREWSSRIVELEGETEKESVAERAKLERLLRDHETSIFKQRQAHWADQDRVRRDPTFGMLTLDFSSYETMDRGKVRVLDVVITHQSEDGASLERYYVDFLALPCSKRRRDCVQWVLVELQRMGLLTKGEYVVWSDAGTSDFHNAPAIFAFNEIAKLFKKKKWATLSAMCFFASRHGWSDCDRHFGAVKRKIQAWYATEAPEDKALMLDFAQILKFLQEMHNTTPSDCSNVQLDGVVCDSVPGLTALYCFRPIYDGDSAVNASPYTDSAFGHVVKLSGKFVTYSEAMARIQNA